MDKCDILTQQIHSDLSILYFEHVENFKVVYQTLLKWMYFHSLLSLLISFVHEFIVCFSLLGNEPF